MQSARHGVRLLDTLVVTHSGRAASCLKTRMAVTVEALRLRRRYGSKRHQMEKNGQAKQARAGSAKTDTMGGHSIRPSDEHSRIKQPPATPKIHRKRTLQNYLVNRKMFGISVLVGVAVLGGFHESHPDNKTYDSCTKMRSSCTRRQVGRPFRGNFPFGRN